MEPVLGNLSPHQEHSPIEETANGACAAPSSGVAQERNPSSEDVCSDTESSDGELSVRSVCGDDDMGHQQEQEGGVGLMVSDFRQ